MNFLAAHDCVVDFREFRTPSAATGASPKAIGMPFKIKDPIPPTSRPHKTALPF
jgi:hypothetical protein